MARRNETKTSAYEIESNKLAFREWLAEESGQNEPDRDMAHALSLVRTALHEELTKTQLKYAVCYYVDGLNMREIGALHGVSTPTVSRTLKRARNKLRRVLKYANPKFLRGDLIG